MDAEEAVKVSEHANGVEHWEHQSLRGRREKNKGDWEGVAKEIECGVTESGWMDGGEKVEMSHWVIIIVSNGNNNRSVSVGFHTMGLSDDLRENRGRLNWEVRISLTPQRIIVQNSEVRLGSIHSSSPCYL